MKQFKDLNSLFKHIEKQASSVLKNEVAKEVVDTMKEKVEEEVYSKYNPKTYQRTGGLLNDIDVEVVDDNTISVENVRFDDGRDVAQIVETGIGYQYDLIDERMMNGWDGGERPFTKATREELRKTGKLKNAMKSGLQKRGLDAR